MLVVRPWAHGAHAVALPSAKVPFAHGAGAAPGSAQAWPAGHGAHSVAPAALYSPGAQSEPARGRSRRVARARRDAPRARAVRGPLRGAPGSTRIKTPDASQRIEPAKALVPLAQSAGSSAGSSQEKPPGHSSQRGAPVTFPVKRPVGHAAQCVALPGAAVPGSQGAGATATFVQLWPSGQETQYCQFDSENAPSPQSAGAAPELGQLYPAGHAVQFVRLPRE